MSQTKICNKALASIGKTTISSIDESSEAARVCKLFYDDTRKTVLRAIDWPFASKTAALALIDGETIPGWDYLYTYPADAVEIRKIIGWDSSGGDTGEEWIRTIAPESLTPAIATDFEDAYAKYTANVEDTTLFDYLFVEAFEAKLAMDIAFILTKSFDISKTAAAFYQLKIKQASVRARNEEKPPIHTNTWYVSTRG